MKIHQGSSESASVVIVKGIYLQVFSQQCRKKLLNLLSTISRTKYSDFTNWQQTKTLIMWGQFLVVLIATLITFEYKTMASIPLITATLHEYTEMQNQLLLQFC